MKRSIFFSALASVLALTASASAQDADPIAATPPTAPATATPTATATTTAPPTSAPDNPDALRSSPARRFESPFLVDLGARVGFIRSEGFDPFSPNDVFSQVSLGASWEMLHAGRFALALGARFEQGSRSSTARGAKSQFSQMRPSVALEGRLYATPWLFGFARFAPGLAYQRAKLEEPSAPANLLKDEWLPAGDLSLGLAGLAPVSTQVKIGGTIDLGYGYVPGMKMDLRPDLPPEDPRRTASVNLKDLDASGAFFRLGLVVVF